MKVPSMKALSVLFTLVLFLSSSCNDDEVIPKRSDEELISLTLEKLTTNESVLEDVFHETSATVTRTAIQNTLNASSSKTAFITNMNALVEGIFDDRVKSNSQLATKGHVKVFDGNTGTESSVMKTINEIVVNSSVEDPFVTYSNKVKSLLDAANASGRGAILLIAKIVDEETSQSAPSDEVSLDFQKIHFMHELQDHIIHSGKNGISAETDGEIESILAQDGIPPVAIGLLLPAVQKIRESAVSETASLPYWDWLIDIVNPEINGGLNRDIIRRYNAAGFMGALQLLLSDEYVNDNQDIASMVLLRARYQASLMFIWSDIWDKTKLAEAMQERVRSNEHVLENVFIETAKIVTRKAILDARAASANKAAFIKNMNGLVEDVFYKELQKNSEKYGGGVLIATGDLDGDGTSSQLAELVIKNQADPLNAYANVIQDRIDALSKSQGNTVGDLSQSFTIVNRVIQSDGEKESYMSATRGSISDAKKIKDVVLNGRKSGADPEKAIEDLRVQYGIPLPLMGMLLPAVQKVGNYSGTTETADTQYLQWIHSLGPMTTAGASHDMVTRYDAAGYLGALHLFVSDKYRSDNQDYASLLLMKARYQASLTMLFGDLWDK